MPATITMVKTVCCESYKICGRRCSLCPHRAENQEALEAYRAAARKFSLRGEEAHAVFTAQSTAEESLAARRA